ncbi:poly(rC)-binding protein 3 isoform X22 [Falco rusticolus]|uniref:poly(rC)-binding protein 3 isoform X22 n=1 Tax=Falco rusticolus TaxID=120794 RepID=UPI00188669E0|nr:poly(rC)-binding protein 3 isoform X22 [Falco rusticolus]XP_055573853.1 poly(rC)-binding protein 3 isoform X23 [Falco cherrug]
MGYGLPIQPHTMATLKVSPHPSNHVPAPDLGADPVLFWTTLGHVFPLGCFTFFHFHSRSDARVLPLPATQPALAVPLHPCPPVPMPASSPGYHPVMISSGAAGFTPGTAHCPDAAGLSIPSRSSPRAETQLGSQEKPALPARTSVPWGNKGKNAHFDLFLHLELYFPQCTSPLLPPGPAKGLWVGDSPSGFRQLAKPPFCCGSLLVTPAKPAPLGAKSVWALVLGPSASEWEVIFPLPMPSLAPPSLGAQPHGRSHWPCMEVSACGTVWGGLSQLVGSIMGPQAKNVLIPTPSQHLYPRASPEGKPLPACRNSGSFCS